jgi:D-3-phosphoglycerate dehydrogenase / 2-oxoglutarate reductase
MPIAYITADQLMDRPAPHIAILEAGGFEVRMSKNRFLINSSTSEAEIIDNLKEADAVLASGELYSANILQQLPKLRVVARIGVGYDRVDVAAATSLNKLVTITPNANHECVAEHTMALMFAAAKNVVQNNLNVHAGKWERHLTEPLRGKVFGILGLGRIGRSLAIRLKALGMQVLACEQYPQQAFVQQHGIELVSLNELFIRSDYLSLHCPVTAETEGIINEKTLAKMKSGSVLINTARGNLVVEKDLHAALVSGHIRCACLDVLEQEPPPQNHIFFNMPNVILAPHLGGLDKLSIQSMGNEAAFCCVELLAGRWPTGCVVNENLRANWKW